MSPFLVVFSEPVKARESSPVVDEDLDEQSKFGSHVVRAKRSVTPDYYVYASVSNVPGDPHASGNYMREQREYERMSEMEMLRNKGPRMLHGRRKVKPSM